MTTYLTATCWTNTGTQIRRRFPNGKKEMALFFFEEENEYIWEDVLEAHGNDPEAVSPALIHSNIQEAMEELSAAVNEDWLIVRYEIASYRKY